jgi:spoIIIJ-associated protein
MVYEFEGRTEKEAIDKAAEELGLEKDDFDVEIIEAHRQGIFKKGLVKIRVHLDVPGRTAAREEENNNRKKPIEPRKAERKAEDSAAPSGKALFGEPTPRNEFETKLAEFTSGLIERMGYSGKVSIQFREAHKLGLKIDSEYSSILIGKKGKNLDALQILVNIYAGRLGREDVRVILDTENYRIRREESLVRMAYSAAEKVRESRGSLLLEPMNPFDR